MAHTDLSIPICVFNTILVLLFLRLKTPTAPLKEKVRKMDIMYVFVNLCTSSLTLALRGNVLIIVSTTSIVVGLTWGGIRYPWLSTHVLSPLVVGFIGLGGFIIYEIYFCKPPIVSPFSGVRLW